MKASPALQHDKEIRRKRLKSVKEKGTQDGRCRIVKDQWESGEISASEAGRRLSVSCPTFLQWGWEDVRNRNGRKIQCLVVWQ